ncbi:MAG TPA: xanthine dehydrogenase family protein molybdopterin-binding subunit, partial [Actinomycetota bacterium]|nr:xanthine dehydrogenase family protein molybdopterin-binding subunit [Actinomycetota bacterium]
PVTSRTNPGEPTADARVPDHWPVAKDRVRYMGEIVAVVVADSRQHAVDATEAVEVDYDELPVVTGIEEAMAEDAPVIHEQYGDNLMYTWDMRNGDVDRVFSEAPVVVKERYFHPRLVANAIEPRAVVVQPVPAQGEFTVWTATQIPHFVRVFLTLCLGIPETKLRIIAPEVGGGFGSKLEVYAEEFIAVALARRLGQPIKWVETRSEGYLATVQGRGVIQDMEVAATEEGKLLGVRASLKADMGAYNSLCGPGIPILGAFHYHGVYDCEAYSFSCVGVYTNRTPTDAYRGAGRPEATYATERIMDALARRVGKDPAEIRAMNFIPPFDQPRMTAGTLEYDSGNYAEALAKAKEMVGYDELRREQEANDGRRDGKLLGVGISSYMEVCGWAPSQVLGSLQYAGGGWERASVRCNPTGKITVVVGTSAHGQGHHTTFSQITADALGVTPDDVEVLHGDTSIATWGLDTYGSRSLSSGGTAIYKAAEKVREKARRLAAHELEVAEEDLEWTDGKFQVKGAPDRAKTIPELAFSAWSAHKMPEGVDPVLEASAVFDPPNWTYPSGTHICVVEIDPETGSTRIDKYVAVDDCGNVINPLIVEGQVMGGVAQGIAEALYEEALYDENGTLLTGNMSTYRIPSAAELPGYVLDREVTPSTTNPIGVKGIGEAGTIAAPPAVLNAVADALRFVGVEFIDKPASAEKVWRVIQEAKGQAPPERAPSGGGTGAASMTPEEEGGVA